MAQKVLAITEQINGVFRKVTYEAVSEGKRIADSLGTKLTVLVIGSEIEKTAEELCEYGADKILVADAPSLKEFLVDRYTQVAAGVIENEQPSVVIAGASSIGKDLMARLAARISAPLAMDCLDIKVDGDLIKAIRPMYGGKILAEVSLEGTPKMLGIRPNAMRIDKLSGEGVIEKCQANFEEGDLKFVDKSLETGMVELTEADIIVAGGRGMGGPDYSLLEELADLTGGAVGASRSAVDEGWRPQGDQIGQTGKTVSPNLYIACGISGAIQHLAGMSSSKVIVAINKDAEAPIFSKADYGIVGDLFDIVPAVIKEIRSVKE
jgi:electron transfer flavoprotein alpha subunit